MSFFSCRKLLPTVSKHVEMERKVNRELRGAIQTHSSSCLSVLFVLWSRGGGTEQLSHWLSCMVEASLCTRGSEVRFPLLALLWRANSISSFLCLFGASVSLSLRWVNIFCSLLHVSTSFSFQSLTFVILTLPLKANVTVCPTQLSHLPAYLVRNMTATQPSRNALFRVACLLL